MTKADVISEIAAKTGIEKADVSATVEKFFEVVRNSMANGDNIYVRGFGSFVNKKRAQKVARKVIRKGEKGEPMIIPAHFVPSFKPAKEFISMIKTSNKIK